MSSPFPYRNSQELMFERFRYVCRAICLLKPGALCRIWRTDRRSGGFREKSGAYGKSLEVSKILHMGCAGGKSGLVCRRRPVLPPTIIIPHRGQFVNRQFTQKKESFFSSLSQCNQQHRLRKTVYHSRSRCKVLGCFPHFLRKCHTLRILRFHSKGI